MLMQRGDRKRIAEPLVMVAALLWSLVSALTVSFAV